MLASEVRDAAIAQILAVTLDSKVGPGDRFNIYRGAKEPEQAPERTAMVKLLSTGRDPTNTCARFVLHQVVVFYAPSPDIDDRIADDNLRLDDALWTLHTADADITAVEVSDSTVSDGDTLMATRRDVRVVYLHE